MNGLNEEARHFVAAYDRGFAGLPLQPGQLDAVPGSCQEAARLGFLYGAGDRRRLGGRMLPAVIASYKREGA